LCRDDYPRDLGTERRRVKIGEGRGGAREARVFNY